MGFMKLKQQVFEFNERQGHCQSCLVDSRRCDPVTFKKFGMGFTVAGCWCRGWEEKILRLTWILRLT